MTLLPAYMREGLALIPNDRPVHLLTRHSIREEPDNGFAHYKLPLTLEGRNLAFEWGEQLTSSIAACFSSPVQRCLDTATQMLAGANIVLPITKSKVLVEPGCYVTDLRQAGRTFLQVGVLDFINLHLKNEAKGVLSPAEGQLKLLSYLQSHEPPAGKLAIHVTHDTILAAFVAGLVGTPQITSNDWPKMLEGLWLWFDGGQVRWVWRGAIGQRDIV